MPLITGSVFLAGALLSCLLPIALLISFATFFYRQARRAPASAVTPAAERPVTTPEGSGTPAPPSHPQPGL